MKINAALTALLLPLASIAWGQADVALVQSQEKAKLIVQAAKQSFKQSPTASPVAGTDKAKPSASPDKFISMADLLKGASDEAKLELLNSLTLVDGKVASVSLALVRRDVGEAGVREILSALNPHPGKVYKIIPPFNTLGLCTPDHCDDAACRPIGDRRGCLPVARHMCFSGCN